MSDHTERFTGRAEDYDRYRQRYPVDTILDRLRSWTGLTPAWRIADIGAGTGMLSEVFLANGNAVIAIEPNADMRRFMQTRLAPTHRTAQLRIIEGTAEATTLPDRSVELVGVGRALHWFDRNRAIAEFRRILVPRGWVAVVALDRRRDADDPEMKHQVAAFDQVIANAGTDYSKVRARYGTYERINEWFGDGEMHQAEIHGTRELDWDSFRGHTLSLSTAPRVDAPNFAEFERAMRSYFDAHARAGILTIPVTCWITAARLP